MENTEKKKLGIYVHSPYCIQKCKYCDFTSYAMNPDPSYYEQLCIEIRQFAEQFADGRIVDTVFFGGGTPTLADPAWLKAVLHAIKDVYETAEDLEISVEANPETLTEEKLAGLKDAGFNRLSIGVQSLNDDVLKALGRVHTADKAREAIELAKKYFNNISIDLMFGVPGLDMKNWTDTVSEALSMDLAHISFYSLQLEENTVLYREYKDGKLELPSWDTNRNMYHYARGAFEKAGYHHYEISNAAKPGYECRHNLKYWTMEDYLGFGLSAHSFIDGARFERTVNELIGSPKSIGELKGDFIFTELRLVDGFKLKDYKDMFGQSFLQEYKAPLEKLFEEGYLEQTSDGRLKFTSAGLDNTNNVMERLLNA